MTAIKRRKSKKRKQTKRKYLQMLCDLKVERKKYLTRDAAVAGFP